MWVVSRSELMRMGHFTMLNVREWNVRGFRNFQLHSADMWVPLSNLAVDHSKPYWGTFRRPVPMSVFRAYLSLCYYMFQHQSPTMSMPFRIFPYQDDTKLEVLSSASCVRCAICLMCRLTKTNQIILTEAIGEICFARCYLRMFPRLINHSSFYVRGWSRFRRKSKRPSLSLQLCRNSCVWS